MTTVPSKDTESLQGTVSPKAPRVYRCLTAQDGHSFAEDRLYNSLWNYRQARMDANEYRLVTAGWDLMAKLSGMTPRNAKQNCFRLVAKLALEKVQAHNSDQRIGATYRVYSYAAIIRRRREAGLEWITRNRGGVTFVQPAGETRDTVSSQATVSSQNRGTVSSGDTPLSQRKVKEEASTSTTGLMPTRDTVPLVSAAIAKYLTVDDDVVYLIIEGCRAKDPACTLDEIAHFAAVSAAKICRQRNVDNPAGLLISQAPKFFPGNELSAYRARRAQELAESRETARRVLEDPQASAQEQEWAQGVLTAGKG
jgi:hypothetical protein